MNTTNRDPPFVVTKHVPGGTVRVHIPVRTPEQERKFLEHLDGVIRKAFPGRRLMELN